MTIPFRRNSLITKFRATWPWTAAILIVLALAFALRFYYLTLFVYHIDEYFTLAAAKLIADSGQPLFPTGLFYDPGLPFSYLDGLLFRLLGFSEAVGRWPAVIFSTLAVVTLYWLGAHVLRSRWLGLLAALLLTLDVSSVEWGGRARMISLAQWLALLSVALLWLGLTRPSTKHRMGFVLCYGLTLLTHFSTVVLLPAWLAAGAIFWRLPTKSSSPSPVAVKKVTLKALMRDGVLLLLVSGLALSSGALFQPPPSVEFQTAEEQGLVAKVAALFGKFLQFPPDLAHAWDSYGTYFLGPPHRLILVFAVIGLTISLGHILTGKTKRRDTGGLFLGALFVVVMLTLIFIINSHWQRSRYLLMQTLGIFYLLGGHGLREIVVGIGSRLKRSSLARHSPRIQAALIFIGAVIVIQPFVQPLQWTFDIGYIGWDRYDLAFKHVADNIEEGDEVMTMHPPASLLYLNQDDYYLVQASPKLIVRPDGSWGDRYTGATWLETAAQFNEVIGSPARQWLVTQEFWLFNSYDGYLQQQILQRMDKLWGEGGVWSLASRAGTWPLARDMETPINGDFVEGTRLAGFTATPDTFGPGSVIWLTLFWQSEAIPHNYKVFVHIRDAENNTVAQADHLIYDGKVPSNRWDSLFKNDVAVRDGATLSLPPDLAPGTYRLLVGFYHPETFERIGVINDQSGEAALILHEFTVE